MNTSTDNLTSPEEAPKKGPYDDLDREDLIKKCKGLLSIAQKAKQSKQDLQNEVDKYKEQIEQSIKEQTADRDTLRTLQELVESLTEQKLSYITELDAANSKNAALSGKYEQALKEVVKLNNDCAGHEARVAELSGRVSELDSEVVSLRRQHLRLQDENEELITQLSELEARAAEFNSLGMQQQEQLQQLEETVERGNLHNTEDYQLKIEELTIQLKSLEKQLETHTEKLNEKDVIIGKFEDRLCEETSKYEIEKSKTEKASMRLKSYRDKIIKCSACISQLKNTKFILLKTVQDYSKSIPKWQDDMVKISGILNTQFDEILSENKVLKLKMADYDQQAAFTQNKIEELQKLNKECLSRNKELNDTIQLLQNKNAEINNDTNEALSLQIKALESEKLMLVKEKQVARDGVVELEAQNKMFVADVKNLKSNIETLESRINYFECENKTLKQQLKEKDTQQCTLLKEQLNHMQEQIKALEIENANLADLNNMLKEEVDTLKSSLEQPNEDGDNLSDLNVSLQTDIMKLETKLGAYKQENGSLLIEVKESRAKIKELIASNSELEEIKAKMVGYKTENSELLNEMKEINQVLKERGESISKQQKAIAEMERLIETLEKDRNDIGESKRDLERSVKQMEEEMGKLKAKSSEDKEEANKINVEFAELQQALAEKETVISALKEEVDKLRQQQLASSMEPPNEDMSTSTISRAEDHSRMKELDESFEDKYTKLRIFALKLKKKVNEMTVQLQNAEVDKCKLEKLLSESAANQPPQDQDKLLSVVDAETANIKNLSELNEDHKVKVDEVAPKGDNADNSSGNETDNNTSGIQKDLTKAESGEEKNANMEMERLKSEVARLETRLSEESEQHRLARESLERARRDVKKKSALSLEMEDYERSMRDLTAKMEDNKKKMVQMESTIDTQQGTINSLKTQMKLLEDQIKTEENNNRLTKEELHETTEQLKEKENLVQAKNDVVSKLEQDIETAKRVYEDLNVEMTTMLGEKEKIILALSQDKVDLMTRLKRSEGRSADMEDKLRVTNIELEDLKTEFSSYKVRAQAVLRQNHTVDHGQEERAREEAAALRARVDALTSQLKTASEEVEVARGACVAERRRAAEASGEAARAQQRTARLHADLQRLTQQLDAERDQTELQITTLTQCYKSQVAELEARLERETGELRRRLAEAGAGGGAGAGAGAPPPDDGSDGELDLGVNVSMLPREEGEGSEAAPSPPPSKLMGGGARARSPVPLERLLEEGVREEDAADGAGLGLTADQELYDARRKLSDQIKRVEHVTQLLAESERECARLSQLGELLKAELRRARGSQHAHNTQYMKNVTLKFLTLPAGDERERLVPVLQKVLTLSNEEAHTLAAVARGQDPNSKGGWGSYLPWSSGK